MKITTRNVQFRDPNGRMVSSAIIANGSLHDEVIDYLDNNPQALGDAVAGTTESWLTENITQPTNPVVTTNLDPGVSGAAADSAAVATKLRELEGQISQNAGFPTEAKTALLEFLRLVAVKTPSASRYYDALEEALDTTVEVPLYTFDTGTVTQNSGKRNLTVDGNHFIFTNNSASTSGTGYYGDISHVARNTSAGTSNSIYSGGTKMFTVPAGSTVKLTITPISVECLDSKLWNVVPYSSDGTVISSAISAFTPSKTEPSTTTFVVENAFDVCCFGTFVANSYSKVEASVKMYVDGVRYI